MENVVYIDSLRFAHSEQRKERLVNAPSVSVSVGCTTRLDVLECSTKDIAVPIRLLRLRCLGLWNPLALIDAACQTADGSMRPAVINWVLSIRKDMEDKARP